MSAYRIASSSCSAAATASPVGSQIRPVGGQHDQLRAGQCHDAGSLGERTVVADVHADRHEAGAVNGQRLVAGRGEAVDAKLRQVQLAVAGDEPLRAHEDAGVVEARAIGLEQPHDDERLGLAAHVGQAGDSGAGDWLGEGASLVEAVEAVAGQGAFGEDGQPRARAGRFLDGSDDAGEVAVGFAEGDVHLHAGDFEGGHGGSPSVH
jgi:hypothetical protein